MVLVNRTPTEAETGGLEEIGVLEDPETERLKFGMSERSDRRKEREFGEFQ